MNAAKAATPKKATTSAVVLLECIIANHFSSPVLINADTSFLIVALSVPEEGRSHSSPEQETRHLSRHDQIDPVG
jgi:hypothetical protein